MIVWVLKDSGYRGFYEALGGVYVGEQDHEVWGEKYKVVGYGWEQLADFNRRINVEGWGRLLKLKCFLHLIFSSP